MYTRTCALLHDDCVDCRLYDTVVRVPLDRYTRMLCPLCGGRDTQYAPQIRPALSALHDIGYKFMAITLNCHSGGQYSENAFWRVTFGLNAVYSEEVFKGLPKKFSTIRHRPDPYLGASSGISTLVYEDTSSIMEIYGDDTAYQRREREILASLNDKLLRWARLIERRGYVAVWQLAGYFDKGVR